MRWIKHFVRLLCCLWMLPACHAEAIDVLAGERLSVVGQQWCATRQEETFSSVLNQGCTLATLQAADLAPGFDTRAFWLKLELRNPGQQPVTRWLSIGHPRLEKVDLLTSTAAGWQQRALGIATPLASRGEVERAYGVFPIDLPADSVQTVWVRVWSQTSVDLTPTIWTPVAYREFSGLHQISLTLALGGLLLAMAFAAAAFMFTREKSYLFFSVSMAGEILFETFRAGLLQRFLWPVDLALPVEIAAFSSFISTTAFVLFFVAFLPANHAHRRAWQVFYGCYVVTALAQLISIFIAYQPAVGFWSISVNALILSGLTVAFLGYRTGMPAARILLGGFVFLAVFELLRLTSLFGFLPFSWREILIGPWALVMTTPITLFSIFQRSRDLHADLIRSEAEKAAKTAFLAHMSHELRTPLDTILGNAQLMSRQGAHRSLNEGLLNIKESGRHLLGMIDEIIDHARGEAGRLDLMTEPVDWADFLHTIHQVAFVLAAGQGNVFSIERCGEQPHGVFIDPSRLRQVLDNLLANAARHTHNGLISLRCIATPLDKQQCRLDFCVRDNGEGIQPEDLERIFQPFQRGKNAHLAGKGTGMGLAISKQLIHAMGGEVRVKSQAGQGAEFSFSLTVSVCEAGLKHAGHLNNLHPVAYKGEPKQILLVEDDDDTSSIIDDLLTSLGFKVRTVRTTQAANEVLQSSYIDLVLTDQFLLEGSGWEVLEMLRQTHGLLPVVLISSATPQRPENLSPQIEFDGFHMKPIEHLLLIEQIGSMLGLAWIFDEDQSALIEEVSISVEEYPDADQLIYLEQLVYGGQISEIMAWANSLPTTHPNLSKYANQLYWAAKNIDFPHLEKLTRLPQ